MPNLMWNKRIWDGDYNWARRGEEWSDPWGSSEAQWFGSLYPRLHCFLPVMNLLEIAPGFGRWTHYLLEHVKGHYTGVDLSQTCVDHCKARFSGLNNAKFLINDGLSLDNVKNDMYDFIFSFDSLVHADSSVHKAYIPQILHKLTRNGVAFIHHSNWAQSGSTCNFSCRAEDVSASDYAEWIEHTGGHVIIQECLNWNTEKKIDAFTLFCRSDRDVLPKIELIENSSFMLEASIIRKVQNRYNKRY